MEEDKMSEFEKAIADAREMMTPAPKPIQILGVKTILVAEVTQTDKSDIRRVRTHTYTSFDRDKLIKHIESCFSIKLVKNESDDFPYFTDGGFKFHWEDEYEIYDIVCHSKVIIGHTDDSKTEFSKEDIIESLPTSMEIECIEKDSRHTGSDYWLGVLVGKREGAKWCRGKVAKHFGVEPKFE